MCEIRQCEECCTGGNDLNAMIKPTSVQHFELSLAYWTNKFAMVSQALRLTARASTSSLLREGKGAPLTPEWDQMMMMWYNNGTSLAEACFSTSGYAMRMELAHHSFTREAKSTYKIWDVGSTRRTTSNFKAISKIIIRSDGSRSMFGSRNWVPKGERFRKRDTTRSIQAKFGKDSVVQFRPESTQMNRIGTNGFWSESRICLEKEFSNGVMILEIQQLEQSAGSSRN
ncbi:hypothetical protein C8R47DRAFT_1204580 [Mycena vitilis]|nr:hypothetical protein C8R47DRAFT_1204580 [Mycena vitilis]